MSKQWRDVVGYEGRYQVSDRGEVRSLGRIAWNGNSWHRLQGRVLRPNVLPKGYLSVCLCKNGRPKRTYVHHLVLQAFVGPCPVGMEACHSPNRDVSDNRLTNLRWDTPSLNNLDKRQHGTSTLGIAMVWGEKVHTAVLTEAQAVKVREMWAGGGYTVAHLARVFGVSWATMKSLLHGETWKHLLQSRATREVEA